MDEGKPTPTTLSASQLGKLLLMQSVLDSLPNEDSIRSFITRGLSELPGVMAVRICEAPGEFPGQDYIRFPLQVGGVSKGELLVSCNDRAAFQPYAEYVENFCFMLAVILEERQQRRQREVKQVTLEKLVQERTSELEGEVAERRRAEQHVRALLEEAEHSRKVLLGILEDEKRVEGSLKQRAQELAALNSMGRMVDASLTWEDTTAALLVGMISAVHPDLAFLFLREGERLILSGAQPAASSARLGEVPEHRVGLCICGLAALEKKPLYSRDIYQDCRCTWDECKRAGFKSFAALPLVSRDEVLGVIGLASVAERDFEQLGGFLETLANQAAVALVKTRLHETVRQELAERRRAEELLRQSQERYALAERATQDGLWDWNLLTNEEYFSPRFKEMLGLKDDDLPGHNSAFLNRLHPEDRAEVDEATRQHLESGRRYQVEFRLRHADGSYRWMVSRGEAVCDTTGRPVRMVGAVTDITGPKQAEAALRESEERYRSIFANAPVGIFQSVQDRLLFVNPAMARMFGYTSPAEMLADKPNPSSFYAHPEQRSQMLRESMSSGIYVNHEVKERRKDGSTFTTSTHMRVVSDPAGNLQFIEGFVEDVTERRQAELGMRFQHRLSQVLLGLPSLADRLDETAFIQQALEQTEELTGSRLSFTHFVSDDGQTTRLVTWSSRTLALFGPSIANRHDPLTEAEIWVDALRQQRPVLFNDYAARPRNEGQPEALSELKRLISVPILENNQVVMLMGVGNKGDDYQEHDVNAVQHIANLVWRLTQRRREAAARARLAIAIEQAAETVMITDTKGEILYVNPAFEKTTGYTRAEALAQNFRWSQSGQQDEEFYLRLWDTLRRGEVWTGHFSNQRKDGTLFQEEATISPVRDADGAVINYVAVKRDVTREVQLEAQIRQTQKMEAIGTLAGGIAHDFNNILAAMYGFVHLLQLDTEGNTQAQESIGEILKACNRAKDLVQQILTFSRQREQKPQVIKLDTVIKEVLKFLRASLPAQIKIEMSLDPAAPAVLADPTQIHQVTMNLATNALHAMEGQSGRLAVSLERFSPEVAFLQAHRESKPIEYARLTIADTGRGMDAKTLERIFEPFFTTKPVGKGTGLGLAVVHGIVQSSGGLITVASEVGRGSTFRLYFPSQPDVIVAVAAPAPRAARGQNQRILLLDDEPSLTTMLKRLLTRLNYQVICSNSASEAVGWCRENSAQFDLVLTDLTMPEMDGLEVARQIRSVRPDMPVILMSGYSAALNDDVLGEAGINELIEKPISMSALGAAVQRALTPRG
jgi:PAS domain S-box-containing protein